MENNKHELEYDLIIIGGGPAGMMAGISARENYKDMRIAIVDGTISLGRKLQISGAGRANLTNDRLRDGYDKYYYDSDKGILNGVFIDFSYQDLLSFFKKLGLKYYIESKNSSGKLFPITNQAKNIVEIFKAYLKNLGIDIYLDTKIIRIDKDGDKFSLISRDKVFISNKVILSTGGRTYPALGSDGSGYELLKGLGHKIKNPVVSAVPLVTKDRILHFLQGTKITGKVSIYDHDKLIRSDEGDVIFTEYGLSGSSILNVSRDVSIIINRMNKAFVKLILNSVCMDRDEVDKHLSQIGDRLDLPESLYGLVHYKLADYFTREMRINGNYNDLEGELKNKLLDLLTGYEFNITGTRGWNESEFTSGGVMTDEIDPKTLESLKVKGLYLCGEVIDIDGMIGGFNLTWAFCSGYVAGRMK